MELEDAMREWGINKSTRNMIRASKAGKAMENYILG